jgi:hypothetical protein
MLLEIQDEVFGALSWHGVLDCWLGAIAWPPGLHTEVAIWTAADAGSAGLRTARQAFDWLKAHEEHARRCVASNMVGLYNDTWRNAEEPISADEFMGRIELMRIGIQEDGSLLLSYDAGEQFGGHVLDAAFGPDRSLRDCQLIG